jgi:hypothetical protein
LTQAVEDFWFWQMLLQKSFLGDGRKFLGPLMRFARGDVGDPHFFARNHHGLSYPRYRALQRYRRLKINFREIFGIVRFSTFATVSALSGRTGFCLAVRLLGCADIILERHVEAFSFRDQPERPHRGPGAIP